MKLASKLTLFLVLGMCIVLALDFWASVGSEFRLHTEDMRHDQHVSGQALGESFAEMWKSQGRERALALLDQTNRAAGLSYARWIEFDAVGGRLGAELPSSVRASMKDGGVVQQQIDEAHGPGRFATYVPVRIDGSIFGVIELSESLSGMQRYFRATLQRRITTALALVALSGLIAAVLGAQFVGRPIRSLVDKTKRTAIGDLTGPLNFDQRDEIGELAREIDAMCGKLGEAREQIALEISARIEAIHQLRHSDRLATVGKLASGVAHELGTPLNVALQRARMISSGEVAGAEAADGARIIAEQTQRMSAVIRQLLDFARRHTPTKASQELNHVAQRTVKLLGPLAMRKGVTLATAPGESGTIADVDAEQIQQALTNLVVNGIDAMENGGDLLVSVGTRVAHPPADHGGPSATYVCLSVRDHGPGILPEHMPHVFEPFFTTKDVGAGTGLGLAVAYGIVRDHGGWIEVESKPGLGSTFSIYLPEGGRSGASDHGSKPCHGPGPPQGVAVSGEWT